MSYYVPSNNKKKNYNNNNFNFDKRKVFKCSICARSDNNLSELFICTDECNHEMCRECAKKHVLTKKDENKHANCPFSCNMVIPDYKLLEILNFDEFIKFKDQLLVNCDLKQLKLEENEIIAYCLTPNCKNVVFCSKEQFIWNCDICSHQNCHNCKKDVTNQLEHNCVEDIKKNENDDNENDDIEIVAKKLKDLHRISRCPRCQAGVEKIDGCNHITCICGNHFCHLCNAFLDKDDLGAHFNEQHKKYDD